MDRLATEIAQRLRDSTVPTGITNEQTFEQLFVEPAVVESVRQYEQALGREPSGDGSPHIEVALHGWSPKGVRKADLTPEQRLRSEGWTRSKRWSVMNAWGRHTPDVAIRDQETGATLIVEVKFGRLSGGGLPTGELQRMIGQCVLAKLKHIGVVAVFGYCGDLKKADEVGLETWFKSQGIELVLCKVAD